MDYQKLYTHLFNASTNAVKELEQQNYGTAKKILVEAQQGAEEMYMAAEDEA